MQLSIYFNHHTCTELYIIYNVQSDVFSSCHTTNSVYSFGDKGLIAPNIPLLFITISWLYGSAGMCVYVHVLTRIQCCQSCQVRWFVANIEYK